MKNTLLLLTAGLVVGSVSAQAKPKPVQPTEPAKTAVAAAETPAPAAQPAAPAAEFSMFGTIGAAYADGTYVLTCGGPKFGFKFGDFGLYGGLFPSLVYSDAYRNFSSAATPLRPNLGAGFEIAYKRISIITPVYYMPKDSYHFTIGLAYKFS